MTNSQRVLSAIFNGLRGKEEIDTFKKILYRNPNLYQVQHLQDEYKISSQHAVQLHYAIRWWLLNEHKIAA